MSSSILLQIEGEITGQQAFSWQDLAAIDPQWQIPDVAQIDPNKSGGAVALRGILDAAGVDSTANFVTLHSPQDNFHASLPLSAVADKGMLIYRIKEEVLPITAGGPVRFFIRDFAACHSAEVDECANVKFVERIEFTREKGFDNRPLDDDAHESLHQQEID